MDEDGTPFEEKMPELSTKLYKQFDEADQLEASIKRIWGSLYMANQN